MAAATARGQRTRGALEDAARRLFASRGFAETRVADISRAAGVATASFYAHFRSKQDAYSAVMGRPATPVDTAEEAAGTPRPSTPRGRRTRAELLRAAREVFFADGFLGARVTDITTRAGVASGTFYTYFSSKEDIFREVVREATAELFASSRASLVTSTDDPVERIRAANRLYLSAYGRYGRLISLLDQVASTEESFAELRRAVRRVFVQRAAAGIRRLQAAGRADPALDADTAGSALAAMVGHFAHVWIDLGEPYEEDVAVETLTRLWAQGIGLTVP